MLCRSCYHEVLAGSNFCPRCGARQTEGAIPPAGPIAPPGAAPPAGAAGGNPWEERRARGFFPALGETLQQSIFHPTEFFRRTRSTGAVGSALVYAVIVATLSAVVVLMWQQALGSRFMIWEGHERILPLVDRPSWSVRLLALPLGFALWNIILSGILHLALFFAGGARAGYGATLKAVAYSYSTMAFTVFPFCGAPIGLVWFVVVNIVGLRELHRISTGRAVWAWILPFLLASCLALIGATLLGAALGKLWQQFGGGRFEV